MKFFTDNTVLNNDWLCIKLVDYLKNPKIIEKYKECIIDVGVYDLVNFPYEYSWIVNNLISFDKILEKIPENCLIPFDYPNDMLFKVKDLVLKEKLSKRFIEKTYENSLKYHIQKNYISSIQYKNQDFDSFKFWFDKTNEFIGKNEILGIGNMCKFRRINQFIINALCYTFENTNCNRIHIFGLCTEGITGKRYYNDKLVKEFYNGKTLSDFENEYGLKISVDSTNWTRAITKELKMNHKSNCRKENRQLFYDTYINVLKLRKVKLE